MDNSNSKLIIQDKMLTNPAVSVDQCCCNKIIYMPINAFIQYGSELSDFTDPLTGGFYVITDTGDETGNVIAMYIYNGADFVELANANIGSISDTKVIITTNYSELGILQGASQKELNDKIVEKVLHFGDTYVTIVEYQDFVLNTDIRLDALESAISEGLRTPQPFDPADYPLEFPTQTKGFTYKVIDNGSVGNVFLEIGDMIIYAESGNNPYVVQTNVDRATTTIRGIVRLATQAEVDTGMNFEAVIVPATLQAKLNALIATQGEVNAGMIGNKYVSPLTLKTIITPLQNASHTHSNKPVLDGLGDSNGHLTYNGKTIIDNTNIGNYVTGDKNHTYNQNTPSTVWRWEHGLGKVVSVTIQNSAGSRIRGEETLNDGVTVEYRFNNPLSGTATSN